MIKYYMLVMVILCSCSKYKGSENSLTYDNVTITFDGYGKYETKDKLTLTITEPEKVKNLNLLKNESQLKWFAALKGTEYVIRLVYTDTKTEEQLLIRILKSTGATPTVEYGAGVMFDKKCSNDQLVNYVGSLIKLEEIRKYRGGLSQEAYDRLILESRD